VPSNSIDSLTSPTLKHLRERWWNDEFTEFLAETLRPRPGNRILDVGCGEGLAEVAIGRLHLSQIRLVGVDIVVSKAIEARRETRAHNQRVAFAAADAVCLPFKDGAFDSTYCVAVLQHVADVPTAVAEFARVTRAGGRVVAVEPDNAARYAYSSTPSGALVFGSVARLFAAVSAARGEGADGAVGPKLPGLFSHYAIEPVDVRLFPVAHTLLGAPAAELWRDRRHAIERTSTQVTNEDIQRLSARCLELLSQYEAEADEAGPSFVEIQNTTLVATVGQKLET
jgi:SAM-dependent methyltransferase